MVILVSLVGAQPAPNVLPLDHINPGRVILVYTKTTQKVAQNTQRLLASEKPAIVVDTFFLEDAYDLKDICDQLEAYLEKSVSTTDELIFNLTGGTKVMSFAAFELAKRRSTRTFYYQSEENKSEIHHYHFEGGTLVVDDSEPINTNLTLDQYLRLYLGGYNLEKLAPHHVFENLVFDALDDLGPDFEVIKRVCPLQETVNELDCVIRHGSVIAVVEIKTTADKKTVEEVNNITAEYLGAYTKKIIVHANVLGWGTLELVEAHKIVCIHLPSYRQTQKTALSAQDKTHLCHTIKKVMAR